MIYNKLFLTDENQSLLTIYARKKIKGNGIGGIIYGLIIIIASIGVVGEHIIYIGLILLGLIMLTVGILAFIKPTITSLLLKTITCLLLLVWILCITILNTFTYNVQFDPQWLLILLIVTFTLFHYYGVYRMYRKLHPISEKIKNISNEVIKNSTQLSIDLFNSEIKNEENIVEFIGGGFRLKIEDNKVFFSGKNLNKAFVCDKDEFRELIIVESKKIKLIINHPLEGNIMFTTDKKNTEKLKRILGIN